MKKFFCIPILFIIAVLISGCGFNFAVPEKVGIKTSDEAVYNLSITNKSFSLGEFFSISSFLRTDNNENENENENEQNNNENQFKFYDYNPVNANTDNIQMYLMKKELEKISLDEISRSVQNTNISASLDNMNIKKEIEVPDVNTMEKQAVDLSINQKVNALVTITGETKPSSDVTFVNKKDENGNDTADGFTSITYESGFMTIRSEDPFRVITGRVILKKEGVELSRASFSNGEAKLPLDGVTIVKEGLTFEFPDAATGIPFIGTVDSKTDNSPEDTVDSVVKSVKGLTITDGVPFKASQETPISQDESLISYTIATGRVTILLELPPEWEGKNVDIEYVMTLSGALELSEDEEPITNTNPELSLNGRTFTNGSKLKTEVNGSFTLDHSDLDFIEKYIDEDGNEAIRNISPFSSVDVFVEKIAEAVVKLDDDYRTRIDDEPSPLPEDVTKNIKKIRWDEYGFTVSCLNTLPLGNPVTMVFTSDFFNFDGKEKTLPNTNARDENSEPIPEELLDFLHISNKNNNNIFYDTEIGEGEGKFTAVDILADIILPGYDENQHTITVKNMRPGETYKLELEIVPVLDWGTIWIDAKDRNESGEASTGLDISSIFGSMQETVGSEFADNLEFTRIPLYLFAEIPEVSESEYGKELADFFNTAKFTGVIKAYIGNDNKEPVEGVDGNEVYLLREDEDLAFEKGVSFDLTENQVITNDITVELPNSTPSDLAPLLNTKAQGSLCVYYDIGLETDSGQDEIAITEEQLDAMIHNGSATISLSVLGIIPLEFRVKQDIDMNLLKLTGRDTDEENFDLLGRTEDPDYSTIEEFSKAIRNVQIIYESNRTPFISRPTSETVDDMSIIVDMDGDKADYNPQILKITGDALKLRPTDVLKYPLNPSISLRIPEGTLAIPRESIFETKLFLKIETSGEIIWLSSLKSKEEGGN